MMQKIGRLSIKICQKFVFSQNDDLIQVKILSAP